MSFLLDRIALYKERDFQDLRNHYLKLYEGQSPHTLFITCSDSRLCPNEFTQSKTGELFMIRNAGNLIPEFNPKFPTNEAVSLEYGVLALKVNQIVICGHRGCGAMCSLMDVDDLEALPLIQSVLKKYKQENWHEIEGYKNLDDLIAWNVRKQMASLLSYPFIREKLKQKNLGIYGVVYDFVNADVTYSCEMNSLGEVCDGHK